MTSQDIVGKAIKSATRMKDSRFDDEAWIKLEFTDGCQFEVN